ncbi:MAG: CRISPR-associated endonuclease Cas3'' [Deltaproteobacteria bacterium]|nr:CRISPR-associated endonuclease Cas3'' [Deltaproteobacteria bacterium]
MIKEGQPLKADHESHLWIKDIREATPVRGFYLAKMKRTGLTKKGDPFLSVTLADRTGEVDARLWERAEELSSLFKEGDILDVEGQASSYRNQIQVTLSGLKVAEDGGDSSLFLEATTRNVTEMMGSMKDLLKEIKNPHLKILVEKFLSDSHFVTLFKKAPAAKNFHHNYLGGLLEHTLSVCQMSRSVAEHYPDLDRDLLMTGAFLHDIGKIKELRYHTQIDYTDEGRLLGHLMLGVAMVDEKLPRLKNFPQELAICLKHLILSHHGQYEFGSPKRPKFLEAFAIHLADDLDAKMNGLSRFMERDRQEGAWTEFNRLFERYFLKYKTPVAEEKEDTSPSKDDRQKVLFNT